jgi:CheY-like chemotaxis protein
MKRLNNNEPVTILLAEDDQDQASIYKMRFKAIGAQVDLANNGHQALEYLEKQTPDLLITDIMMPVMDGYELVTELRQRKNMLYLPIVVLTAVTDVDNREKFSPLNVADFCEKTLRWKVFQERIIKILKQQKIIA